MPERDYEHIRIRHPDLFSRFNVITKMSHLDEDDQKLVRRRVPKNQRASCKYTVGKLKGDKKIKGRSWKLQKIMKPKGSKKMGEKRKKKRKRKRKK